MNAGMIVLISIVGYVIVGFGTARAVFTKCYKTEYPRWVAAKERVGRKNPNRDYITDSDRRTRDHDAHWLTVHDMDVVTPTIWSGALWVVVLPYLLVFKPLGTVVWPLLVKWFTGPARKAVAS